MDCSIVGEGSDARAQLPRLGAHPSQVAAFHTYCAAFSNADLERFPTFYTEDVRLELGRVPPILGRQGIIDFYRRMFQRVREHLTVNTVVATDQTIELDAVTRFTAMQDAPDFVVGALKAGEYIEGRVLVSYQLREGLIAKISVAGASSGGVRAWPNTLVVLVYTNALTPTEAASSSRFNVPVILVSTKSCRV
jgi:hypothetical protein